jgi:signal transduction histidine kinase
MLPGVLLAGIMAFLMVCQAMPEGIGTSRRWRADRDRHAMELHEEVLQSLVLARAALDLEHPGGVAERLDSSIVATRRVINGLTQPCRP